MDYQINNYGVSSTYGTSSASSSSSTQKSSASTLDTTDFLKLLAAQMSNQDVMNPVQDTEFISQMAQFTSLQSIENLSQVSYSQYGASLVGKTVTVAKYDDYGKYVEDTGVVSACNFSSDGFELSVNGKTYDLSSVMEVKTPETAAEV
ncbi:MAG: hypothetical protein GX424_01100 [Clostridiales bacterium]|nr:hypothetical protein [Clostridiales bacterium]